jgi:hypothetical protein
MCLSAIRRGRNGIADLGVNGLCLFCVNVNRADDGEKDHAGYEGVFDRRSTAFIYQESFEHLPIPMIAGPEASNVGYLKEQAADKDRLRPVSVQSVWTIFIIAKPF